MKSSASFVIVPGRVDDIPLVQRLADEVWREHYPSILSGAHMTLFPRVLDLLREAGRDDVLITGGGIIPKEDMEELQRRGTGKLFGPGTSTSDLVDYIRGWFEEREGAGARSSER